MADPAGIKRDVRLVFPESLYRKLEEHLFPGDFKEHGAAMAAGLAVTPSGTRLLVREIWPAKEPEDYRLGARYMGLQAPFIHRCLVRCRDERLVYLAVHNHGGSGRVAFSDVDLSSHIRGYPALLDIADGMPVGAVVAANGALEVDLWHPNGARSSLQEARILGPAVTRYYPNPHLRPEAYAKPQQEDESHARQVLFLGPPGQALLQQAKVAVIGLGGIGSMVSEYLARLGVGHLVLIDPDRLEASNISRVVGSGPDDVSANPRNSTLKVDIADRMARQAQSSIAVERIADDFSSESVARRVLDCDFIFLAADSMRARLVFNAIVHQYYIPGVQLGTKVTVDSKSGRVDGAFSVVRSVRPGYGCLLCNQLIDPSRLAMEWKSDAERKDQQYGISMPNPSVISMNAVAAAHGVNDFLFGFSAIRTGEKALYRRYDHLSQVTNYEEPRRDPNCSECSERRTARLGMGDARALPTVLPSNIDVV